MTLLEIFLKGREANQEISVQEVEHFIKEKKRNRLTLLRFFLDLTKELIKNRPQRKFPSIDAHDFTLIDDRKLDNYICLQILTFDHERNYTSLVDAIEHRYRFKKERDFIRRLKY